MKKKIFMTLGAISATVAPVAVVVACSKAADAAEAMTKVIPAKIEIAKGYAGAEGLQKIAKNVDDNKFSIHPDESLNKGNSEIIFKALNENLEFKAKLAALIKEHPGVKSSGMATSWQFSVKENFSENKMVFSVEVVAWIDGQIETATGPDVTITFAT